MSSGDLNNDFDQSVDLDFLTPDEKDAILAVLARDENLKRKEEERIDQLKRQIRELRAEEFSRISFDASRICGRCLQEFSWFFNKGQVCSKCRLRVCKKCRQLLNNKTWMCLMCLKILELETQTGSWFYANYPQNKKNMSSCQIISAIDLLRSSLNQSQTPNPNEATMLIGQFRNHMTSMTQLPSVSMPEEEDEESEKLSDSDSLFNKFLSSSTPNLSLKSPSLDKGSLTNLYVTDVKELQEELPQHSKPLSPQTHDEVFELKNLDVISMDQSQDSMVMSSSSLLLDLNIRNKSHPNSNPDIDGTLMEDSKSDSKESISGQQVISSNEVKIVVAEEDDSQIDLTVKNEPLDFTEGSKELMSKENIGTSSPSIGNSSDAVRLKVSALLAKYGREDVKTSYNAVYESILKTATDEGDNNDIDDNASNSSPTLPVTTEALPKFSDKFFPSDPTRPHSLDRKYRSTDNSPTCDTSVEDISPVVESLGGEDDEDDDDDPLQRFLRNEALLQRQRRDDCGFSSAVSWVTGGNYDLDWEASDEEAPFSIQDFDHVSTGFLDDENGSRGAFSDLRSVINNILRQSSHENPESENIEGEELEDEEEEEERGDTLVLPVSSSIPNIRGGIPMLRKKSLSVISEHTEPSACSSFDESSFVGEFPEKDEYHNEPSSLSSGLR